VREHCYAKNTVLAYRWPHRGPAPTRA
jgi:hypothetical protein